MEVLSPGDPEEVGGYRLLGRLGSGGMGRVYLGRSRGGRMVAVKLVHAELAGDPVFLRRFRREVEAARRVGGEWTAPVLDADTESAAPWVATGYVPGPTLTETVERHGPLPEDSVLALAAGLARALQAVHACDLIHRDLKPSNVLVTIDGPRVIDFGIVRAVDASVATRSGALIGSPPFMAPEQVRGADVTAACDVFSLGSVLAYAATGRRPFGSGANGLHALLFRVLQEPPDLEGMSGPVRALAESCLAKEPERRPTPAEILESLPPVPDRWLPAEVLAELGRHAAGLLALDTAEAPAGPGAATTTPPTVPAPPPGTTAPPPETNTRSPARRRGRLVAAGAAAAVGTVVAGLVIVLLDGDRTNATGSGGGAGRGDVPTAMVGTWDGSAHKSEGDTWWHHRVTLVQGELGTDVARIRMVGRDQICEYTATMTSASPSVTLRPRLTRSIPPGQCAVPPSQSMTQNGADVHWGSQDMAGTLNRAKHESVPAELRGRWWGTAAGLTVVPTQGMRRQFDIGGGAVGTESIKITTTVGDLTCESTAMLISAEEKIYFVPIRLLTRTSRCVLGGGQYLAPSGVGLAWEDAETGEGANLQRS
ncbi:serine/threonine-protein kinase [Actinomadura algeriensis]|uniref:Protein kinase domain-containing protein n=1 Tax=Actinomadura algeriensis TaxID=1679523 RepID=A0ABR9JNA6_9ACTN|nr:serine/threonine-protein kinase [Actinomadura algeriensis]MBE1532037.1 hypothetical protein [Actinomadura algeriensis]